MQIALIPYLLIAWIIAFILLVAFNRIKTNYPIYLFGIALGLLWQTSLLGQGVVGADIQMEYYVSSIAMNNIGAANSYQYGASAVITILAPFLAKGLGIELIWVFKSILPIFLACVPVIMYFVYKKLMDNKKALWASIFFIIVPVMSLEIIGIAKAMVAEVFMALFILVIVSSMKQWHKAILLPLLAMLTMVSHYSVGLVLWIFMVGCFLFSAFIKILNRNWYASKVSMWVLGLALLITTVLGYAYFNQVDSGSIVNSVNNVVVNTASTVTDIPSTSNPSIIVSNQSPLVQAGIGMDFLSASIGGKLFRVVQYLTQFLIVVGLIQLWRKRKEYNFTLEYVGLVLGGLAVLAGCILLPYFSNILNMTRFYHLSLFFLSPLFILGCMAIRRTWFIPAVLIIYFIFTSGLVYEVTKSTVYERIDTPYSYALSYERTGITGVYNQDDINCAKWLANESDQLPIITDMNTLRLMFNFIDHYPRLFYIDQYYRQYEVSSPISGRYYIFLDTWNQKHGKFVYNYDVSYPAGLRRTMDIPSCIYHLPVAYQSGQAIVLFGGSD